MASPEPEPAAETGAWEHLRSPEGRAMRARLAAVYLPIFGMALLGWAVVMAYTRSHSVGGLGAPVLEQHAHHLVTVLALGTVCFLLGFRHAMDVDHIAAIDNVTRKLANDGQRAVGVGFFFSFGHSVAVLAMAALLVAGELYLKKDFTKYGDLIDEVGSSVCALVLYVLALMNLPVLLGIFGNYKKLDAGAMTPEQFDEANQQRGFMNRYFKRFYRGIHSSWQMFPIGVLFGLGFDTATEMVVLAATASAAGSGALPLPMAFVCLMLFFASMMFLDTSDSIVMLFAYRWAFSDPRRKTMYNLSMTGISMLIAFGIGTVEWLQVVSTALGFKGSVWVWLNNLDLTTMGVASALGFLVLWAIAMLVYRKLGPVEQDERGQDLGNPGADGAAA